MHACRTYADEVRALETAGLYKSERLIETPQAVRIRVGGREVRNFCANNYLGLANDERLKAAARQGLDEYGLGMSSVRFICGTQTIHKKLEQSISEFLGTEDTILYSSCFDANGGFFEPLLDDHDAVGFSYPVVHQGMARIRVQISAAHTPEDIDSAIAAFRKVYSRIQA